MTKQGEETTMGSREGAWAAAGFAAVLVLVGLPVWWYTTTVYRAQLPYSDIVNLSGQLRYHGVAMTLVSATPSAFSADLERNLRSLQGIKFHISSRKPRKEELDLIKSAESIADLDSKMTRKMHVSAGTLAVFVVPEPKYFEKDNVSIIVGRHRLIFVRPDVDMQSLATVVKTMVIDPLANKRALGSRLLHQLPGMHKKEAMRQVPTEPAYDVTLTLMVPEPHRTRIDWDAKAAVNDYLQPVVNQLEKVTKLIVRSQVLYMSGLNVSPKWSTHHDHYALPQEQLPLTINAIEAKLGSFVWTRPSLHFVIYIPREKQRPLHIHTSDGQPLETNSFLVPRWGGVMIHNIPPAEANASFPHHVTLDSHWIMSTVLTHLHRLLPIPSVKEMEGLKLLPSENTCLLTEWQLDGLARARVSYYLSSIRITLQSLWELVGEISNMVISDEVGGWVWGAVEEWSECGQAAREGRLQEATLYCSRSFTQADAAFFHPSMLALLYFPDNQKYAIYVPLFLPVSIPVLLSLKMVLSLYWKPAARKEKVD
nr:GPI transamidase component PIG-S-like [Procambarus clarkii]XP_045616241.1 GPI transamidase component PIG-S-like [Procambarus clarkii]XP_045616242.1 GPI transamidase component PIG-S-like [Procambarus clarkii]XP_045616243.1 GPI transamidase component PIG-S-like [Procambarus clarkii]